ncbi:MAG: PSD1 and planctomycete cytochrome C domain-containing protein [Planctomycetaceae bacterium]
MSNLRLLKLLILSLSVSATSTGRAAEPAAAELEFFEKKIRPVLVAHCYQCHSSKSKTVRGNLLLDSRDALLAGGDSGPAVIPGQPTKSPLIMALHYDGLEMPPKGRLPQAVIQDFERWVQTGAADPRVATHPRKSRQIDYEQARRFWAFRPPRRSPLPKVEQASWVRDELDRFVLHRLEANGLQPAPAADRRTLARRVHFDLIGLPPDPQSVEQFVNDPSDQAYEQLLDRLLESPHYGERWGRFWLDIARYGEDQAHTFKARKYPRGYLYRDWVVRALNEDMPYDRFVQYQIAGDLFDTPGQHERVAALGLFALGPVYYQDNGEKAKALADEWDDRVDTLMRGTQALTIACARCHDHKYDPLTMDDYYGLVGIFASSQYRERPVVSAAVVASRKRADRGVQDQQLQIDRFLAASARAVRLELVDEIPRMWIAAWKATHRLQSEKNRKKVLADVAKQEKVNPELLNRWLAWIAEKPGSGRVAEKRQYLESWRMLISGQDPAQKLISDVDAVGRVAAEFQQRVRSLLPVREALFVKFGENVAFVNPADQAVAVPGVIPLGNLFDDLKGCRLSSAIASDTFKSVASAKQCGVERVLQGWGQTTEIAKGVRFLFDKLGSDGRKHGSVTNDAWSAEGGLSTQSKLCAANLRKTEQGIGMHANALITFDLNEIRQAGLIPTDRPFVFKVDRAGINDDVFGSQAPSAHLAVIVSRPHVTENVFDAVLSAHVNGQEVKVEENDKVYYVAGDVPSPLRADGKFVSFEISIAPQARYLTLVATGAGQARDENSISSDHTVFSGARLEYKPLADASLTQVESAPKSDSQLVLKREDAVLLSEVFSDKGLLAIPAKQAAAYLTDVPKKRLSELQSELKARRKQAESITITMAHALQDGPGTDMRIYLAGDPTKLGDSVPRSFPAIFNGGQRKPFELPGSGRLELARAVGSSQNPLTARVLVNRVWQGHFGHGLVRTPSNFGQLGERPTHPRLLDQLAVDFMESGWSIKALHRRIMLSASYRMSSEFNPRHDDLDPENRRLWRMNRRRLQVEPWRDAMLAVAGRLDRSLGGPSIDLAKPGNQRRTLYGFISRHKLNDLLRLFDFPDPNITAGQRSVTTVPLQQLFVLNSDFVLRQAKALAVRLQQDGADDAERIQRAYALMFSRRPTQTELDDSLEFLRDPELKSAKRLSVWEQYALALLGTNEFMFID